MKFTRKYFLAIIGILFCIIFSITPLAWCNTKVITLYPVFDNFLTDYKLWEWNDISAFSLTHTLLIFITIYGLKKRIAFLLKVSGSLFVINSLFVLFALLLTQINSHNYKDVVFSYGYAWFFIIIGSMLIIISGIKIKISPSQENKIDIST